MVILSNTNSLANQFIAELRSEYIQKDSMRFRKNLERLGEILAYEISKTMIYEDNNIKTSLGSTTIPLIKNNIVLAVILRAGLPFYQGFLNFFDKAESAFIAAYRGTHDSDDHSFTIKMEYLATPSLEGKVLIMIDPMLATGRSLQKAYESICLNGHPIRTHIACAISSRQGVEFIQKNIPNHQLWTGAIDEKMNEKSYIIPGLGDAGDLAFGNKM